MRIALLSACLLVAATSLAATKPGLSAKPKSMQELLDGSVATDWRTPDPDNLLYVNLAAGRVVIELAPAFAPLPVSWAPMVPPEAPAAGAAPPAKDDEGPRPYVPPR